MSSAAPSTSGRGQLGAFKGGRRSRVVRLENGLTVVTRPVPTAPVVSVQVWYRVGTRQESPAKSGLSHLLEHLLFKGTRSRPVQFGWLFSALGSESNAFTAYDSTAYVNTAERGQLEALLTLEADRMTGATLAGLEQERSVVLSELEGYRNDPAYRLDEVVMARAFPDQAIGQPIGGTVTGVEGLTVADLREHYRRFYRPDNAVLTLVGNFDEDQAFALVRRLFGDIEPGAAAERVNEGLDAPPQGPLGLSESGVFQKILGEMAQGGEVLAALGYGVGRSLENNQGDQPSLDSVEESITGQGTVASPLRLQGTGGAPLIQMVYPMPEVGHPDEAALLVLSRVLATGRRSRLNQ
ncbi:MAG: pitrilysin family protein, partial [Cyanobacteria bacterium P01_H01_bin.130]